MLKSCTLTITLACHGHLSGKKSKSVFDFLTYLRETGFSFSHREVEHLIRLIEASNEINRVNKFDKQNDKHFPHYLKIFFQKIQIDF